jgi:hypothetical protein
VERRKEKGNSFKSSVFPSSWKPEKRKSGDVSSIFPSCWIARKEEEMGMRKQFKSTAT